MKKTLWMLSLSALLSGSASEALILFKLEVVNSEPSVNRVVATRVDNGQKLFSCGAGSTVCSAQVPARTQVKLQALPETTNFGFIGWSSSSGAATVCNNNVPTCTFTLNADSKTTATFRRGFNIAYEVGTGTGSIQIRLLSNNVLVGEAGPDTTFAGAKLTEGTRLRVEAVPGPGEQFAGFSPRTGSASVCTQAGATTRCDFTLTQDSSIAANFVPIP